MNKTCSAKELAYLLDCSTRNIRGLAKRGVVVRMARGEYDTRKSVTGVIHHLRRLAEERAGRPETDVVAANAVLRDAKGRLLAARYAKEAATLVVASEARAAWHHIAGICRRLFTSLPDKIASAVPNLSSHDIARIRQMCADDLRDCDLKRGLDPIGGVEPDESTK